LIESSTTIKQLKLINKTRARKIIRKVGLKLSKKTRTRKIIRKIGLQLIVPLFNKENTLKQVTLMDMDKNRYVHKIKITTKDNNC
jgi:hypothetical protein